MRDSTVHVRYILHRWLHPVRHRIRTKILRTRTPAELKDDMIMTSCSRPINLAMAAMEKTII